MRPVQHRDRMKPVEMPRGLHRATGRLQAVTGRRGRRRRRRRSYPMISSGKDARQQRGGGFPHLSKMLLNASQNVSHIQARGTLSLYIYIDLIYVYLCLSRPAAHLCAPRRPDTGAKLRLIPPIRRGSSSRRVIKRPFTW